MLFCDRKPRCALEVGIEYFTAEVLAENRSMIALLPALGRVETESAGPVVTARVEIAEPARQTGQELLDLLTAAARGDIVGIPVLLRRLIRVPDGLAHIVRLPAVADAFGVQFTGTVGYLVWAFVHVLYLIGWGNRLSTLLVWLRSLVFTKNYPQRVITFEQARAGVREESA